MKKPAIAVALILILLFSGVFVSRFIGFVVANPVWLESWTASPNISLNSPLNKTYAGNFLLNFTVAASELWLSNPVGFEPGRELAQELLSVDYYADGNFSGSIASNSNLSSPFHYSASLTELEIGSHSLTVKTRSIGVERDWISSKVHNVPANSSSVTVHFTVAAESSTMPLAGASVAILCLTGGLLVYYKKRRREAARR